MSSCVLNGALGGLKSAKEEWDDIFNGVEGSFMLLLDLGLDDGSVGSRRGALWALKSSSRS